MIEFNIKEQVTHAIDVKGVAILKNHREGTFIEYPEAAIWLLLMGEKNKNIALEQVKAVLFDIDNPEEFVKNCLNNWREADLLY